MPNESVAVATSLFVNAALVVADWLAPDVATNVVAAAGLTVKFADVPATRPWVAVSVVDWASVRVIGTALSTPLLKVNDEPLAQPAAAG